METRTVNLDEIESYNAPCVLALGMFDGLHRGHRRVIARAKAFAKKHGAKVCVLTFSPHPSRVINMGRPPVDMLCPPARRAEMFAEVGVEKVFVKKFTKKFAALAPEKFAEFLAQKFPKLRAVVSGYNFLFGKNAEGDASTLAGLSAKHGWQYSAVAGVYLPDGVRISSSAMRQAVLKADFDAYKKMAGGAYVCAGRLEIGRKIGRKIGFPTLNLPWNPDCKPPFGSYAVELTNCADGRKYRGVASYGTSPTVGKTKPLLETHLFAKGVKIAPPARVSVKLLRFLRPQEKFNSVDELVLNIARDVQNARGFFKKGS